METQDFSFFPATWVSDKAGNNYMVESSFDLYLLLRVDNVTVCVLVVQLGPTLWDPWTEPTRLFRPWILQARILEWVAMPFSRGSSWLRDWTWVSWIAGRVFTIWASREAQQNVISFCIKFPSAPVSAFRLIRMQVAVITLRPRCHWPVRFYPFYLNWEIRQLELNIF